MKNGRTKDGNPHVTFHFDLDYKGKHSHTHALELWTNYPLSFMVTHDGGWVNFHWDGEKWINEMKDEELAVIVIDMLIIGYESRLQVSAD